MLILIVGLRGCGKSTYAKEFIGSSGMAYDMDAIASAFRLRMPHDEYFAPARKMANDFLKGFLFKVTDYVDRVAVIRTAPRTEEAAEIEPDRIVWMKTRYIERPMDDEVSAIIRIKRLMSWADARGIPTEVR